MAISKKEIRECWLDQIRTAKNAADRAIIEDSSDNGSCNFDSCLIKKEKKFTYDETIKMFSECGVNIRKHSQGWFQVAEIKGQADKNTRWHKVFKEWLEEQGFECSMHYQLD